LGVSTAGGLHLATLPGFSSPVAYPGDLEPSLRWFTDDITTPLVTLEPGGTIAVPQGPGLGFSLDRRKVEEYQVYRETFRR
ncbi:MAG: hypothetical protein ACM3RP_00325, partial [Chitinophagales bacterium]